MLDNYIEKGVLEKKLKLITTKSISNMHLHTADGLEIKRYKNTDEIINDFAIIRLEYYQKRKDYYLSKYQIELDLISWKRLFIKYVIDGKIIVFKQKKTVIYAELKKLKFPKMEKNPFQEISNDLSNDLSNDDSINESNDDVIDNGLANDLANDLSNDDSANSDEPKTNVKSKTYDYLLDIKISKFTKEELDKLDNDYKEKEEYIKALKARTVKEMWIDELNEFMEVYRIWDSEQTNEFNNNSKTVMKSGDSANVANAAKATKATKVTKKR
jgi:DNA topoisomerase-2